VEQRLQKILASAGYGSRRSCEDLIVSGRVTVNGEVAHLGSKADIQKDQIKLDGKIIKPPETLHYIALYKPRGVLSTVSAPDPRPTVRDLVPVEGSLFPVGRLDVDSEGLILLTNDGELTNQLTHPRYGHEKEYRVLIARHPDEKQLQAWRHGVVLEDGFRSSPAQVDVETNSGKGSWVRVIMKEGHKHQIREICRQIGLPVVSIIRTRIESLRLGNLKPNQWRYLTVGEVNSLKNPTISKKKQTYKRSKKNIPTGKSKKLDK
jgi:23S rRNA pseudouridine2605 synthase